MNLNYILNAGHTKTVFLFGNVRAELLSHMYNIYITYMRYTRVQMKATVCIVVEEHVRADRRNMKLYKVPVRFLVYLRELYQWWPMRDL